MQRKKKKKYTYVDGLSAHTLVPPGPTAAFLSPHEAPPANGRSVGSVRLCVDSLLAQAGPITQLSRA